MGAEFDSEEITLKKGKSVMEALREALEEKGQADRMDSDYGLFILHDVTVKTINHLPLEGDEVVCTVEYEYGG